MFKEENLRITTETGGRAVEFLDVVMDLSDGSHGPFVKPNTTTKYVSVMSNHPKTIIKTIPSGVNKRLSANSSNEEQFLKQSDHFQEALQEAGHQHKLEFSEKQEKSSKKNRQRKVLWFNPPWSMNIRTTVARDFLSLIKKHFPVGSPLHKLFNQFNVKVSYSTVPNMKQHINNHNNKVLRKVSEGRQDRTPKCNCDPETCELDRQCQVEEIVYRADVKIGSEEKYYIGQTKNTFRQRYSLHESNMRHDRRSTALCTYLLDKKAEGIEPDSVKWSVVSATHKRRRGERSCSLCTTEKVNIANGDTDKILNKRSEVMRKCKHREELMLENYLSRTGR